MNQNYALAKLLETLVGTGGPQGHMAQGGQMPTSRPVVPMSPNKSNKPQRPHKRPGWSKRPPANMAQLWKQLSANAGQQFMPGGYVGAVRKNAWEPGIGQTGPGQLRIKPGFRDGEPLVDPGYELNPNDGDYGETGGEATFFTQAMNGGMTPLAAAGFGLGVPIGWNPFRKPHRKPKPGQGR